MSHRSLQPLLALAVLFFCHVAIAQETATINLVDIRADLEPFEDVDRYDYVGEDYEYAVIDNEKYDDIYYRSALLAAQLFQVREAANRYKAGELDRGNEEDADFLVLMSAESLVTLPDIITEAEQISSQISDLNPRRDFRTRPLQAVRAARGLAQAGRNLQQVLEARSDIDAILDDYKALQNDLDLVEAGANG